MNKNILRFVIFLIQSSLLASSIPSYISYLDPVPGANYVKPGSTIIIRPGSMISGELNVKITGSISGTHRYKMDISDDRTTLLFKPNIKFTSGEMVTVLIPENLNNNKSRNNFSYTFNVSAENVSSHYTRSYNQNPILGELNPADIKGYNIGDPNPLNVNEFPEITINCSTEPSNGYIFISDFAGSATSTVNPFLLILDNKAQTYFSRRMDAGCFDFKLQPNGFLTYYYGPTNCFFELDSMYNPIDSFFCGNGYLADLHELRILSNGHALLMSYDTQNVDMQPIVPGGNPNARVAGLIIQEIDQHKNVVFQWRSWDHFLITDATHEDLTASRIDYAHGNAIELDNDGNILISSRHMDEITKINRNTGSIIWRMGGKNNQFTFVNDPVGFSHQHAIRRISNGNITLFDNGNYHTPNFSRAIEYSLDEKNLTATLVWQYKNNIDIHGFAMGYVQRLDNGNTIIGWGTGSPSVTEVKYDGTKVFEISLPDQVYSYRAYRNDWKEKIYVPTSYKLGQNYPNPFNPSTSIVFEILQESNVHLKVYDVLGRQVTELINSKLSPGKYTSVWNAQGYASGVYFYKIIAGDFIETKKMMLVK